MDRIFSCGTYRIFVCYLLFAVVESLLFYELKKSDVSSSRSFKVMLGLQ